MRPLLIYTRRFPSHKYHAITLFPFIFYNSKPLSERDLRHETVHLWQQVTLMVVFFYFLYLIFWLSGLLRYCDGNKAYREIPFERSAYLLESELDVKPTVRAFHWLKCLKNKRQ